MNARKMGLLVRWLILGGLIIFGIVLVVRSVANSPVPQQVQTIEATQQPSATPIPPTEEPAQPPATPIPPTEEPAQPEIPSAVQPGTYVVQSTDIRGLYGIAEDLGIDPQALLDANANLASSNYTIRPGDVINLPGSEGAFRSAGASVSWESLIDFPTLLSDPVSFDGGFYFFPSGDTEGTVKVPETGGGFVATGGAVITNLNDGLSNTYTGDEDTGYIIWLRPGNTYLIKTLVSSSIQMYYSISMEDLGKETQIAIATMFDPNSGNCGDGCPIVLERRGIPDGNKVYYRAPAGVDSVEMKDIVARFEAEDDVFVVPENNPDTHGVIFECLSSDCFINGVAQPVGYTLVRQAVPTDLRIETNDSYIVKVSGTVQVTWYFTGLPEGY